MNSKIIKSQNKKLENNVSNTINHWLGLNMAIDNPMYSKKLYQQIRDKKSTQYKNLYNNLSSDIDNLYSIQGIGTAFDDYSKKYNKYFDSFNQKLNKSTQITIQMIISVMETGLKNGFNAERIAKAVNIVVKERINVLESYLYKYSGQLENYMLLLKGIKNGKSKYKIIAAPERICNECENLDGKTFNIADAETGVNYPPIHLNCKCNIEIIDSNVPSFNSKNVNDLNDLLNGLPYIDNDVVQIETENNDKKVLVARDKELWEQIYYSLKNTTENLTRIGVNGLRYITNELLQNIQGATAILTPFLDRIAALSNYEYNKRFSFNDHINGQATKNYKDIKMGAFTSEHNGCGWIATYNACKSLGKIIQPAEIINYYDNNGGTLINGAIGVNPFSIESFLMENGFNPTQTFFPEDIDNRIINAKVTILVYFHSGGAHYVAIEYNNGVFNVYNRYSDKNKTYPYDSIDELINDEGYTAFTLITIE